LSTSKEELKALAQGIGLKVTSAVSGKTALLVAADPWSQSGKAQGARQLGVRIVTEQVFRYFVEQILAGQQPQYAALPPTAPANPKFPPVIGVCGR